MKICCISDTHGQHAALDGQMPDADVLVHAGDLTSMGKLAQLRDAAAWLQEQAERYEDVICIGGNHDFSLEAFMKEGFEGELRKKIFGKVTYLRDSGVTIKGKHFYGSPWSPRFYDWAFNADRGVTIKRYWDLIPMYTDVLITHGPPYRVLDWVGMERVGCEDLRDAVERVKPSLHVFGHIHCAHGEANGMNGTKFINASVLDDSYIPRHAPTVIEI